VDLFSEAMRRDPYPAYERMRGAMPALHDPATDIWLLFDHESVRGALSRPETFSSNLTAATGRPAPRWMIFLDPPRHTRLRALVASAFMPRAIGSLETRIREITRELLDAVIERGEMDLAADFAVPLPLRIIAELIGMPPSDWPRLRRWSDAILDLGYTIWDNAEKAEASRGYHETTNEMREALALWVEERRASPRNDLLGRLVQAEVDGERLTEDDVLDFVQMLLIAGNETTSNLIGNAMLCLLENPDELSRLESAPELLESAVEETLRYRSPVQWVFRGTARDVEVHGMRIAAGKLVFLGIGSANRDPAQFQEADRFIVSRRPNPHIAFGHGPHVCLGAALSRLEARVALSDLLARLKHIEPASGEPWKPRRGLNVHGPESLPLRFEPAGRAAR